MRPFDCDTAGLFEGFGGLTMATRQVFGGDLGWYSEIEPAACRLLEHHHPGAPNLGDITQIDWSKAPRPRRLTGGFPCQDVSPAGLLLGLRPGTRSGLWTHFAYAIDQLRPELVVIENVRGLLSAEAACDLEPCPWCLGDLEQRPLRALGAVLGDLAAVGYDARWVGLRASDPPVYAPHERYRVIVIAHPHGERLEGHGLPSGGPGEQPVAASVTPAGPEFDWAEYTPAIRCWERRIGRAAPWPVDAAGEESPAFVEWMMGLPAGHVTAVPGLSRNEQLKLLGNGVVPAQCEAALRWLLALGTAEAAA